MRYYIESDGKVFLVSREGTLDLPRRAEVPFPLQEIAPLATSTPVIFCSPKLEKHPREWLGKDEIIGLPGVALLVREAVHAGMPRVVVEGVCLKGSTVLLVKGSRGLTKGHWSLPGGFLRFGETPREGLLREVREELNVEAQITGLLDVKAKLGKESHLHWTMVFYRISLFGKPAPDPDEIMAAEYFPLPRAKELLFDDLMREVIASHLNAFKVIEGPC
jgi:ADP-ribose pyrophosphatase YjhB (NUDIX family)